MRAAGVGIIQIVQQLKLAPTRVKRALLTSQVYQTKSFSATPQCYISKIQNEEKVFSENEMIHVINENGNYMKYPWLWLRDNCQCKTCFNPQMQSRTIDWKYFDTSVHPKSYSRSKDLVNITWSDEHESQYSLKWLQEREFVPATQKKWLTQVYRLTQVPWNAANFSQVLKRFQYSNLIESEEFVVRNKPDTTNLAYLAVPLQMHTDMPYYDYKPGVNMLHCMEQTTEGGENQFVDCLYLSQLLKETQPDIYKTLSTVPVDWSDIGEEKKDAFHTLYRAPVICEDKLGQFARVNYNQWQRDSHFNVPLEDVISWYKANAIFTKALYDQKNMVQLKTRPGEIVTFDNIRLVHGRSGYSDSANNERYIIGSYLDWDIVSDYNVNEMMNAIFIQIVSLASKNTTIRKLPQIYRKNHVSNLPKMLVKCLHNGNIPQPHSHENNNGIKAKVSSIDEVIQVQSADGNVLKYPWIWLRDNCQCSSCFNPKLQSRTIDWRTFDITVNPKSLHINNNILSIQWSDGHCSEFTLKWLHERSFTKDKQEKWLNDVYRLPKIPWSAADFPSVLKKFDYSDVIQSDSYLYEWLKALAEYGVAIVENTPIQEDQLRKLANRVSFIKRTHYGEEFEVRNKPDTTNVAYLSTPLQMHADLPYYEYKPGVNLLHCLVQTTGEGGDNLLTDCLHVSKILKEFHPEVYKILSTTLVEWSDIGEERGMKFFSLYRSPAI
ncbi:uncharacterized protein GBIM_05850, partial [Gryllus bimaculatus]